MGLISRVSSRTYRPKKNLTMSFVNPEDFQHILRVQNTNIDGNIKVTHAITSIRGMGRRFTDLVLKKAEIDRSKRAGQLTEAEMEQIQTVMANPKNFKIPTWFLHRQPDDLQQLGQQASRGHREDEEDPTPSRYPTLVGLPSQRSEDQDQWSTRSNLRRSPKEVNLICS